MRFFEDRRVQVVSRFVGLAVGASLIGVEIFDAMVTPAVDWFWFAVAACLLILALTFEPSANQQ